MERSNGKRSDPTEHVWLETTRTPLFSFPPADRATKVDALGQGKSPKSPAGPVADIVVFMRADQPRRPYRVAVVMRGDTGQVHEQGGTFTSGTGAFNAGVRFVRVLRERGDL